MVSRKNLTVVIKTGIVVLLSLLNFIFTSTVVLVNASSDPLIHIKVGSGISQVNNIFSEINSICRDNGLTAFATVYASSDPNAGIAVAEGECVIQLHMVNYKAWTSVNKKLIMGETLNKINNSSLPQRIRLKLYNFVAEQDNATSALVRQLSQDVNADYATAYTWFKPFTGGISTVFGVLTLAIFTFIAFTMILDLGYLVLPFFRLCLDRTDGKKPKVVSNEAFKALQEAEQGNTEGKQVVGIYFKNKTVQLFILMLCLTYLVGGKIYTLIAWLVDSFQSAIG